MNGDTTDATRAPRKPRPEIQIYRPGALRQGGSTKNLTAGGGSTTTTNDERLPPRPEKLTSGVIVTSSGASRRRSNDTDSVTSRGESGSTTPDAMAMNERAAGRQRFERRTDGGGGGHSNYVRVLERKSRKNDPNCEKSSILTQKWHFPRKNRSETRSFEFRFDASALYWTFIDFW